LIIIGDLNYSVVVPPSHKSIITLHHRQNARPSK